VSTLAARVAPARLLVWPAIAVSFVLVLAGAGLIAPAAPLLAVLALAAVLAAPMRITALAVLAVSLIADNPGERPMSGLWRSPVAGIGDLLYLNLHAHTHIEALRFSLLELLVSLLVVLVLIRKMLKDPLDDPDGQGVLPNPLKMAFVVFFLAIVGLELLGLARGGDFRNSLWQLRQLFWLPALGLLFGHAFRSARARTALLRTLMVAAAARASLGIYFYVARVRPGGLQVDYVTTHSDSILAVVAMLIAVAAFVERRSLGHLLLNVGLQPLLILGLVVNNRRIALVALAAGLATLILIGPAALRKGLARSLVVILPLAGLYVAAGWTSHAAVFGPVHTLRSISSSEDDSTKTRDIENFNLIQTLKEHPLLGSGFGHEYHEQVQGDRVDQFFSQYRYIAHNSVLWLLSLSGWIGFSLVWTVFLVMVFVARHAYRRARALPDRVTAFGALVAVLCFVIQAWGDMGLQSWMGTLTLTSLTGAAGALFTAQNQEETIA
jgi:O-antigen ligase